MLSNIHRNILGTTTFNAQFPGMRKPAEFDVYPVPRGCSPEQLTIQSDTRMGLVSLATGDVRLSPAVRNPGFWALRDAAPICKLNGEDLFKLRAAVEATAGASVGNSVVRCDNSGAAGALLTGGAT